MATPSVSEQGKCSHRAAENAEEVNSERTPRPLWLCVSISILRTEACISCGDLQSVAADVVFADEADQIVGEVSANVFIPRTDDKLSRLPW